MLKEVKRITVYLPPELHKVLKLHSVETDTTINDLMIDAIKEYVLIKNYENNN